MLMRPRFFAPSLDPERTEVVLPEDESRHLSRVLRLQPGDEVEVFDGAGREFNAVVKAVGRAGVTLHLGKRLDRAGEPHVSVVLAQAVLKPPQMDDVVRDATMMGVGEFVPLLTAHVTVPLRAVAAGRAVERWRRIALASAKQCRRATLPTICEPVPFERWLGESAGPRAHGPTLLLVEPSAEVETRSMRSLLGDPRPSVATLVVGPEGGWLGAEVAAAVRAGCIPVTLGPLTLRADSVALAALAALSVMWEGDWPLKGPVPLRGQAP
jgi:16S rRNA (uracil1498-N3)-methyltransferase